MQSGNPAALQIRVVKLLSFPSTANNVKRCHLEGKRANLAPDLFGSRRLVPWIIRATVERTTGNIDGFLLLLYSIATEKLLPERSQILQP